ncbi:hypothetical protein BDV25DRAFT_131183 [Aspergillus avenaceus]|uniref:MADS-box domain-containing protein n=1 Tax=Aspergillus avenaceus TaxID=36643 RepID=A0A5N6TQT6_ASPAV|nr:hypothetical protein BDV25DRAFT_131183 [Aspergillus avenaceus]
MATKTRTIRQRRVDNAKSRYQQRNRRMSSLFLKAFEYCHLCDADMSIKVRLRHNGEIVVFNSNDNWSPTQAQLATYYPKPKQVTWQELAAKYEG